MGAVSGFKRVLLSSVLGITGCAQTRISAPAVAALQQSEMQFVCGRLDYNGSNPEWLPRAVRAQTDNTHDLIRYRYEVRYGIDDESAFDLFNPFLVFGATKSHDALYVLGELQITSDGRLLKTYREFVTLDKAKSVFSEGETLTAMRQTGLRRVRDLIDTRLAGDKAELDSLGLGCN